MNFEALVLLVVMVVGAAAFWSGYRAGAARASRPIPESELVNAPPAAELQPGWDAHWPDLLDNPAIRHVLDMMPVNIFFKDGVGHIVRVNRSLANATGISQEHWVGRAVMDLSGDQSEKYLSDDQYVFSTGQPCLNIIDSYQGVDGPHWARTDKLPLTGHDGEVVGLVGISVDITEQVHAEQKLESERQMIADLLNVVPVGICVTDEAGHYVLVNDAYCAIYDCKREEIIGQHFLTITPPDQVEVDQAHYARLLAGDLSVPQERKLQRRDGSIVHIEAANGLLARRDGRTYIATVARDVTPRKHAELEREQLIQDLNAYAHMVAHDLKNPLSVILGFTEVLREDADTLSDDDYEMAVDAIDSAAHKMLAIIDELLLLAHVRRESVETEPVDMGWVVQAAQEHLSWMIASASPEIIQPDTWPPVVGYAPWIEEVWTNYISNAIKYGGLPPRVELGATPLDGSVRFWVRDNGAGIPADQLDKLFVPFTRLDQVNKIEGHGLGLSIVQRIVEQLGGEVGVESVIGEGSTFSFTLPCMM